MRFCEKNYKCFQSIGAIATALGVFATLIIVIVTYRSVSIAEKNLELTHNAILFVEEIKISQLDRMDVNPKVNIHFINSGNTQAKKVKFCAYIIRINLTEKKREDVFEEITFIQNISGDLEFYPKQKEIVGFENKKDRFDKEGFYYMICAVSYETATGQKKDYTGYFQLENKSDWLRIGINQDSIKSYKGYLQDYMRKTCEAVGLNPDKFLD